ncbi:MAG TPA: 4Fe-4S dicluster domain-containing protein [Desulfobaccales bacterium]
MDQELNTDNQSSQTQESAPLDEAAPPEKPQPDYEIDIFRDWCKSCGICAAFCPRQCIGLDENGAPVVKDARRCTGCRWCELHCPDFAICVKELVKPEAKTEEAD